MQITTEEAEALYSAAKVKNPELSFSQFCMDIIVARVVAGDPHATLGPKLARPGPWSEAGIPTFNIYRRLVDLKPFHRLVDFGCGSLRVGYHSMRYLERGNFFGMELNGALLDMGRNLVGAETLEEKKPTLRVITDESIAEASSFGADAVVSTAVAFHVHPDDTTRYFRALVSAASKPGCKVLFDTKVSPKAGRINIMAWSWPLEFYKESLAPLIFVKSHHEKPYKADFPCTAAYLEFERSA